MTKNQIKKAASLHHKKYRDYHDAFLVEGVKLVGEALAAGAEIEMIVYRGQDHRRDQGRHRNEGQSALPHLPYPLPSSASGTAVLSATPAEMVRISALKTPPPILAVCRKPRSITGGSVAGGSVAGAGFQTTDYPDRFFILDGVSDPGNLGTILRTCDWFGLSHLVCSSDSVDIYNPKVVQASMGAVFRVHTVYTAVASFLETLPGHFSVWAADTQGQSLYTREIPRHTVVIFGSEAHGIRRDIRNSIDHTFTIPRYGTGESLNLAVAVAVTAAEIRRPRAPR